MKPWQLTILLLPLARMQHQECNTTLLTVEHLQMRMTWKVASVAAGDVNALVPFITSSQMPLTDGAFVRTRDVAAKCPWVKGGSVVERSQFIREQK